MLYILVITLILILFYTIRVSYIKKDLDKKELEITNNFNARTNMIPAIFEVTEWTFSKHDDIFKEILKHRKQELYKYYIKEYTDNLEKESKSLVKACKDKRCGLNGKFVSSAYIDIFTFMPFTSSYYFTYFNCQYFNCQYLNCQDK